MAIHSPVHPDDRAPVPMFRLPKVPGVVRALLGVVALAIAGGGYVWFVQRVEVPSGKVLVLVNKTGQALPAEAEGQVVLFPALLERLGEPTNSTKYRGIVYAVLPEGRHFRDPFFWQREIKDAAFIGPDEIGIRIRKFGKALPAGKVVATEPDERGPLAEVLPPGTRHNINDYAYNVIRVPRVRVPAGSVGVQTLYAGGQPANPNRYVVEEGERGVQPTALPPGIYDINPYAIRVDIIDVRSHTVDFRENEAIHFPSKDSFEILVEGTVEYAIRQDRAPYVMAAVGDHDDIRTKLILPFMRSLARIEGSKLEGCEFISGETRKAFQDRVFDGLREQCHEQGIEIRAALIRRIEPPAAIANPISDRQLADQQKEKYLKEIEKAKADAKFAEQEEMQKQNQATGQARREVVSTIKKAEEGKAVALTQANKRLEVAKLELEAATEIAAALLARGQAEAEVVRLEYEAEARPLRDAIRAFGGGEGYAQYFFYQKLGPAIKSVLASTEGPFAEIFRSLSASEIGLTIQPSGLPAAPEQTAGAIPPPGEGGPP